MNDYIYTILNDVNTNKPEQQNMSHVNHVNKVLLLGESQVGKTKLMHALQNDICKEIGRYQNQNQNSKTHPVAAYGMDQSSSFNMETTQFTTSTNITYEFYDIPGHPGFYQTWTSFLQECDVVILMFDLTDIRTMFQLKTRWFPIIAEYMEPTSAARFILIGNKDDSRYERQVLRSEAETFAERYSMPYHEINIYYPNLSEWFEEILFSISTTDDCGKTFRRICTEEIHKQKEQIYMINDDDDENNSWFRYLNKFVGIFFTTCRKI